MKMKLRDEYVHQMGTVMYSEIQVLLVHVHLNIIMLKTQCKVTNTN